MDPLNIATIEIAPGLGRIGVSMCPGMRGKNAVGASARDLAADLDSIEQWGAAGVLTLINKREMQQFGVQHLRAQVEARHLGWWHLPLEHGGIPGGDDVGPWWATSHYHLLPLLRDGFNVLVHCTDGQERSGVIAADLLVQLGVDADRAMRLVREVRPGAMADFEQELRVIRAQGDVEWLPDGSDEEIADRALGAMLGQAIGDALGTTLEFAARDTRPRLTDMVGGGPFRLAPGQWTDDTAMALALLDSLAAHPSLDEVDLMTRFARWHGEGAYSCTGTCFDIGITTRTALARFKANGNPLAGSSDPHSAGNGSLMRLAPVAIRHWQDRATLRDVAARQSRTTHAAPEAVDACIAFVQVLADAIAGYPRSQVLRMRDYPYAGAIAPIMGGSWRGKRRDEVSATGYVAHSLEAALWCVGRTSTFADAVLLAANLGEDADTTAAITGQLAGALHGASAIPEAWLARLAWREKIEAMVEGVWAARDQG